MSIKFSESQSRKSVHFSEEEEEEEEVPNYEAKAREAARIAVKKEASRGSRETKIEVVRNTIFVPCVKEI